jgi:tripartite-type tricarboxylate transporter receptor subunit TctC
MTMLRIDSMIVPSWQSTKDSCVRLLRPAIMGASVILITMSGHGAWSQTTRTIKIVVPSPPGGGPEMLVRVLADQIRQTQALTMVFENRPGAATIIGTEAVARATPDGNTLLATTTGFVVNPHLRKSNYDPLNSFEPICELASIPQVIAVNSASPYRTLVELLSAARAKPGELTMASIGPASANHIGFEKFKRAANVNITFVPYPSSTPAVTALLGEQVTSMVGDSAVIAEQVKTGKLRALAIASRARIALLPEVPTVAEAGYRDFELEIWSGLFAPAKTPKQTVSQLAGWFTAALQTPMVKAKLEIQGYTSNGVCGADFATSLSKQYNDYGRVIREANIKVE